MSKAFDFGDERYSASLMARTATHEKWVGFDRENPENFQTVTFERGNGRAKQAAAELVYKLISYRGND